MSYFSKSNRSAESFSVFTETQFSKFSEGKKKRGKKTARTRVDARGFNKVRFPNVSQAIKRNKGHP